MALLGACLYDPAVAVIKGTTIAQAMTVIDTTNLRLTFTVPANGAVLVRLQTTLQGSTTFPQIMFGVMEGAAVRGRVAPAGLLNGNASAVNFLTVEAVFVVPSLAPAAPLTWDAAFGVESGVASTGMKYGGPNDATANNSWGAFLYEIWSTG
jgi:hypothetical protein